MTKAIDFLAWTEETSGLRREEEPIALGACLTPAFLTPDWKRYLALGIRRGWSPEIRAAGNPFLA